MTGNEFVYPVFDNEGNTRGGGELRKRELFAAMAMQGLVGKIYGHVDGNGDAEEYASLSVKYADALIEQLNKAK